MFISYIFCYIFVHILFALCYNRDKQKQKVGKV
ncbi:hypothetical protein CoNPh27_CDS0044 [Staphylococcus phage S-CoN_Ph27]|nr:hypothetical protein CoNPh27_CDS0044 [Staphylococcus phage S-CoN_Ph27]